MRGSLSRVDASAFLEARLAAPAGRFRVRGARLSIQRKIDTISSELGELEHRSRRPISCDTDTAFPIGSVTKSFTALDPNSRRYVAADREP